MASSTLRSLESRDDTKRACKKVVDEIDNPTLGNAFGFHLAAAAILELVNQVKETNIKLDKIDNNIDKLGTIIGNVASPQKKEK